MVFLKDSDDLINNDVENASQECAQVPQPIEELECPREEQLPQLPRQSCVHVLPIVDKQTQRPSLPGFPYKNLSDRAKRGARSEVKEHSKTLP